MLRRVEPPSIDTTGPPRRARNLRVFAVDTNSVQIDWSALGPGPARFSSAGNSVEVHADGGPGAVELTGLPAATRVEISVTGSGTIDPAQLTALTLAHPPGAELFRFAAITDLHLGSRRFGRLGTLVERPEPAMAHPLRCATAATRSAGDWGAQLLVAKGDLTESSRPENWADVAVLFANTHLTVLSSPGNHETHHKNTVDPVIEASRHGIEVLRSEIAVDDFPGFRLLRGDTPMDETDWGRIAHIGDDLLDAAADAERPVVLAIHHHFQRWKRATHPPPGIPGPEARAFLDRLSQVRPATLTTSGHTHRHRRRSHGPLVLVETGSTKDYPGTWAGYTVYEGGITQVVRRISEPSCIRWTEWTGRAALGLWRHWSPGTLDDRCFSHTWPI